MRQATAIELFLFLVNGGTTLRRRAAICNSPKRFRLLRAFGSSWPIKEPVVYRTYAYQTDPL
jgi:hypothetical protein